MPFRRLPLLSLVSLLLVALLAGCGSDAATERMPGDPITADEAEVLSGLLYRDFKAGGADFVVSAPYAENAVVTLTGEIDFAQGIGRAQGVTSYGDERPDDTRTLFFTTQDLWYGDVPGLSDALAAAGLPDASYVRRPIATTSATGTASLIDVLVQLVPRLSARAADDPRSFLERDYTWQGTKSVNGDLASLFRSSTGTTIAVAADSHLLLQYVTRLPDQDFDVTITLTDHGERAIELPSDAETVTAADHPEIADAIGV
ncbi:hypothetical protein SAMN05661080_02767 [Modestobacter sp. DSM 44400]|uniref:hypothetical protein n=1 Tax=Modestobacter sp. DSM 44400 TaxID=1550230 RepID=UPI00089A6F8D|nr:hypothetical protein [Modestobacter sp. DSM 44400]SDY22898.1 hypothetical protein SAMN05661080_02767 [Modestobacter sp. DSM 44400]